MSTGEEVSEGKIQNIFLILSGHKRSQCIQSNNKVFHGTFLYVIYIQVLGYAYLLSEMNESNDMGTGGRNSYCFVVMLHVLPEMPQSVI